MSVWSAILKLRSALTLASESPVTRKHPLHFASAVYWTHGLRASSAPFRHKLISEAIPTNVRLTGECGAHQQQKQTNNPNQISTVNGSLLAHVGWFCFPDSDNYADILLSGERATIRPKRAGVHANYAENGIKNARWVPKTSVDPV